MISYIITYKTSSMHLKKKMKNEESLILLNAETKPDLSDMIFHLFYGTDLKLYNAYLGDFRMMTIPVAF